jgi:hypothetical protein
MKMMPLEIVLHQRIQHAHDGGDAGDRQYHDAPPPGRRAGEVEHDPNETVNGDLGHHAAHQSRDMAGSGRMREGQPGVQWYESGLRAGTEQHQQQDQRAGGRGRMHRAHLRKAVKAVRTGQQPECQQQSERTETRHQQINVAGAHIFRHAMMRDHQRPGVERHEFPRQ